MTRFLLSIMIALAAASATLADDPDAYPVARVRWPIGSLGEGGSFATWISGDPLAPYALTTNVTAMLAAYYNSITINLLLEDKVDSESPAYMNLITNTVPRTGTNGWEVGSHDTLVSTNNQAYLDTVSKAAGAVQKNPTSFDIDENGRSVFGTGLSVSNIFSNASGAMQAGASINGGRNTIRWSAHGARQAGYNSGGTNTIGNSAAGSQQGGSNYQGTNSIGEFAYGAQQFGYNYQASAINNAIGALQLYNLGTGQQALTTEDAHGSILLGAGTTSNKYSIVAGDGEVSRGVGSISGSSVWAGGTNVMTEIATKTTPAAVSNIAQAVLAPYTNDIANALQPADTNGWETGSHASFVDAPAVSNIAFSAIRVPYSLPATNAVTIDPANGDYQRLTIAPVVTITFPVGSTNSGTAILLEVPPRGTNSVETATNQTWITYKYGDGLVAGTAFGTNRWTMMHYSSQSASSNGLVRVWEGVPQ